MRTTAAMATAIDRLGHPTAAQCRYALAHLRNEYERSHPRDATSGRFRKRTASDPRPRRV